ncbi:dihydrolipoamide acetyltransferase family protein [Kribbella sp. WER1]
MTDILMPRLSDTMTEGTITTWHKSAGDEIKAGDLLVEIETDKALMDQEAYEPGTLAEILVPEGETAPIGTPIARLTTAASPAGQPAEASGGSAGTTLAPDDPKTAGAGARAVGGRVVGSALVEGVGRVVATPLVRRVARERGIDLGAVRGSGPGGRIVRADLEVVPFDGVRRVVAERLVGSSREVPAFCVTASADVGALVELRRQINDNGVRVSFNDLLVRACALALRAWPGVNASYSPDDGGQTLLHQRVHIGVAVASVGGLVVPVVRDADRLSVGTIATTTQELIAKAKDRKLTPADFSDGTFTISNLGMYGVEHFTAIINPPQGAILAVGAVTDELALDDGVLATRKRLTYTLTADHRIIDGALAAEFLRALTGILESPLRIVT